MPEHTRRLGKSGIEVSALGLGCWPIGGPWTLDGRPVGRGVVDEAEAIHAIHSALDLGIRFFDTAATYGAGRSERILGGALAGRRAEVVIATKFGVRVDEENRTAGRDSKAVLGNVRQDCEDSLRRLGTDWIDLFQLHLGDYPIEKAAALRPALEDLVAEGKIRAYGWSTDEVDRPRVLAEGEHCAAVQHELNLLTDAPVMLALCDDCDLASINKYPLLMGILAGRFGVEATFPADDIRQRAIPLDSEKRTRWFAQLNAVREVLTQDGRTLAQAALGWIWARSDRTIPIPGFRTSSQVEENGRAMDFGPLEDAQMRQIEEILERQPSDREGT